MSQDSAMSSSMVGNTVKRAEWGPSETVSDSTRGTIFTAFAIGQDAVGTGAAASCSDESSTLMDMGGATGCAKGMRTAASCGHEQDPKASRRSSAAAATSAKLTGLHGRFSVS